jgi:hypothetical protein
LRRFGFCGFFRGRFGIGNGFEMRADFFRSGHFD